MSSDCIKYIARAVGRQRNLGLFCLMLLKYFYLTSSLNLFMGIWFLCFVRAKVLCRGHSIYVLILSHLKIKNSSHHFSQLAVIFNLIKFTLSRESWIVSLLELNLSVSYTLTLWFVFL